MAFKGIKYQTDAVSRLLEKVQVGSGRYAFTSPTGSGKTVMMSMFLERFVELQDQEYAFIWASPRQNLPIQSKARMDENRAIDCVFTDTIQANKAIDKNQVWFLNWEQTYGNISKNSERGDSLTDIIKNTRESGLKVMLLIDEAHWAAQRGGTNITYTIDNTIQPDIAIYITATPKADFGQENTVEVAREDVQGEEMIVDSIPLNYRGTDDLSVDADVKLLQMACNRRARLKELYDAEGSNVNPLLMIQIPNADPGEAKRKTILRVLDGYGIENKKNLESLEDGRRDDERVKHISDNDNDIDAVIFKQNVSLGWDCPRAKVLVVFRDIRTPSFRTQVLGRIVRMPEQRYYQNDDLNRGYLYTEYTNFANDDEVMRSLLKTAKMVKRDTTGHIPLPAYHVKSLDPANDIDTDRFKERFEEIAKDFGIMGRFSMKDEPKVSYLYMVDDVVKNQSLSNPEIFLTKRNELYIQKEIECKIQAVFERDDTECKKLFMLDDLVKLIKESINHIFENGGTRLEVERLYTSLTHDENFELVAHVIRSIIKEYAKSLKGIAWEKKERYEWSVPEVSYVSLCDTEKVATHKGCYRDYGEQFTKYAMAPTYLEIVSRYELYFCRYLDRARNVKWWYKNGVGSDAFSVLYEDECLPRRFMVDYIAMTNDGKLGLFDTKGGGTLDVAGPKALGLARYIQDNPSLRLFGGVVTELDGKWMVSDGFDFSPNPGHTSWEELDLHKVDADT